MSKRNITYTKPPEPKFLKKLKKQVGYEEGPSVDTKREQQGPAEDFECEDEHPTIVVLNEGDLSAEQVAKERESLEKESSEAPADLDSRIIFKASSKNRLENKTPKGGDTKSKKPKVKSSLLSFDEEESE